MVEKRAYPLAYCPPGNICGMLSIRGRCPRLLKVVPSRHQSACGVLVMRLPILIGHDVTHSALLPGGQYTRGWGRSLSTRRRISLWLQGSLFCTANGSYFVLWLSVCQGQTRRVGRFSQASLLAWMNLPTWLQRRKPGESNKLFVLFPPKANPSNPSNPW